MTGVDLSDVELPCRPEQLTLEWLNRVMAEGGSGVSLTGFEVTESWVVRDGGGNASSADRMVIAPRYAPGSPGRLPAHIIVKVAKSLNPADYGEHDGAERSGQLYSTEVNVYNKLHPAQFCETPLCFGGIYAPGTKSFLLLLEDLRDRGAQFATIKMPMSQTRMRSLIDQLASLHARFWNSPEFGGALGWMQAHTRGSLHDLFTSERIARYVEYQVGIEQFKTEMLETIRATPRQLHAEFQRAQAHQATLAQTICHGDMHIGNSYILADDQAGILDWQLTSVGYGIHDISYVMVTGMSVGDRRAHERDLLAYYREKLRELGVANPPSLDELWLEYRRAMAWNLYIGWLVTPVRNYGWDVTVNVHHRLTTAYNDLETTKAIASIP